MMLGIPASFMRTARSDILSNRAFRQGDDSRNNKMSPQLKRSIAHQVVWPGCNYWRHLDAKERMQQAEILKGIPQTFRSANLQSARCQR
jgi:hypothetical protein